MSSGDAATETWLVFEPTEMTEGSSTRQGAELANDRSHRGRMHYIEIALNALCFNS